MQEVDPLSVRAEELDAVLEGPRDATEILLRPLQPLAGIARLVGCAEDHEHAVREKDEPAVRAKEPRRLRHPSLRIAPQARAVLGDREVEGRVRKRYLFGAGLDQRELDLPLRHDAPRRLELSGRDVDPDRPSASRREPRREVRGATAELDDVEPGDVAEDTGLGFGHAEDPPADLTLAPGPCRSAVGELFVRLRPERAVARNVVRLRQVRRGRTAPTRA